MAVIYDTFKRSVLNCDWMSQEMMTFIVLMVGETVPRSGFPWQGLTRLLDLFLLLPCFSPPPFLSLPPHCTKWTWDHAWFQMSWPCWIYLDVCELCMSSSHVPSYLCLYAWTSLGVCLRIRVGFVCVLWGFWILCNDKACSLFWDVDREQFLIHVYPGCKLVQWLAGWTVNPEMGRGTGGWRQD